MPARERGGGSGLRLRVVAGLVGGRRLRAPAGDTVRPTSDRVKEAVFSALGDLAGLGVLDLYAGTGALAIEAVSRGASRAVLVEHDPRALGAIDDNLEATGMAGAARVVGRDVTAFLLAGAPTEAPFDLVFVDPPYELADDAVGEVLATLAAGAWLAEDARVVVERGVRGAVRGGVPVPDGWQITWERRYGDTLVRVAESVHVAPGDQRTSP